MRAILATTLLLGTATLLSPRVADADTCSPPRVMVVLDKSSSMQTGSIGGQTKWSIAVNGLGAVLDAHQTRAEFGLMTFPKPNQCSPGSLDVAPATNNRAAILGALSTPPPNAGSWTPMAETLDVAGQETALTSATGAKHVVLITDGWQWCSPYDPSTRFDGVAAAAALEAQGITVWVVGFGADVDAAALNQMAVAAGTARAGCNATNLDPTDPDQCYFQVDNATGLIDALNTIAGSVSAESCNGVDDDCDGIVDEGVTKSCEGECGVGTQTCTAGAFGTCQMTTGGCAGEDQGDDEEDDGNGNTDGDGTGGEPAGCGCQSQGAPSAGAFAPFAVLGAVILRRRRRK